MVVYAPTEEVDEGDKDDFYQTLTTEVTKIRQQYGNSIIIMGDFNARVGTVTGFEHSDMDILGPFGIPDANCLNINGALLREFCTTHSLKVADTYFAADNEDYGTWRHSTGPEFIAALDHILVHESLWNLVRHCGVRFTDYDLPPTDHRVVYLDIAAPQMESAPSGPQARKPPNTPLTEAQSLRKERLRMNKRVLEEIRNKDADRENEQLSSLIAIEVARLMDEYAAKMPLDMDPQEELNQLLAILTTSLDNARLKLWPQGVPFTKTPRPGTWINGEPATLALITSKHKAYMRLRALQRNPDASAE